MNFIYLFGALLLLIKCSYSSSTLAQTVDNLDSNETACCSQLQFTISNSSTLEAGNAMIIFDDNICHKYATLNCWSSNSSTANAIIIVNEDGYSSVTFKKTAVTTCKNGTWVIENPNIDVETIGCYIQEIRQAPALEVAANAPQLTTNAGPVVGEPILEATVNSGATSLAPESGSNSGTTTNIGTGINSTSAATATTSTAGTMANMGAGMGAASGALETSSTAGTMANMGAGMGMASGAPETSSTAGTMANMGAGMGMASGAPENVGTTLPFVNESENTTTGSENLPIELSAENQTNSGSFGDMLEDAANGINGTGMQNDIGNETIVDGAIDGETMPPVLEMPEEGRNETESGGAGEEITGTTHTANQVENVNPPTLAIILAGASGATTIQPATGETSNSIGNNTVGELIEDDNEGEMNDNENAMPESGDMVMDGNSTMSEGEEGEYLNGNDTYAEEEGNGQMGNGTYFEDGEENEYYNVTEYPMSNPGDVAMDDNSTMIHNDDEGIEVVGNGTESNSFGEEVPIVEINNPCTNENEFWAECGTCEPSCDNPGPMCDMYCKDPMCLCMPYFYRYNGSCVEREKCPVEGNELIENNEEMMMNDAENTMLNSEDIATGDNPINEEDIVEGDSQVESNSTDVELEDEPLTNDTESAIPNSGGMVVDGNSTMNGDEENGNMENDANGIIENDEEMENATLESTLNSGGMIMDGNSTMTGDEEENMENDTNNELLDVNNEMENATLEPVLNPSEIGIDDNSTFSEGIEEGESHIENVNNTELIEDNEEMANGNSTAEDVVDKNSNMENGTNSEVIENDEPLVNENATMIEQGEEDPINNIAESEIIGDGGGMENENSTNTGDMVEGEDPMGNDAVSEVSDNDEPIVNENATMIEGEENLMDNNAEGEIIDGEEGMVYENSTLTGGPMANDTVSEVIENDEPMALENVPLIEENGEEQMNNNTEAEIIEDDVGMKNDGIENENSTITGGMEEGDGTGIGIIENDEPIAINNSTISEGVDEGENQLGSNNELIEDDNPAIPNTGEMTIDGNSTMSEGTEAEGNENVSAAGNEEASIVNDTRTCTGDNEIWSACGTCEPTCEEFRPICAMWCQDPMCLCKPNFYRYNNACILWEDCPVVNTTTTMPMEDDEGMIKATLIPIGNDDPIAQETTKTEEESGGVAQTTSGTIAGQAEAVSTGTTTAGFTSGGVTTTTGQASSATTTTVGEPNVPSEFDFEITTTTAKAINGQTTAALEITVVVPTTSTAGAAPTTAVPLNLNEGTTAVASENRLTTAKVVEEEEATTQAIGETPTTSARQSAAVVVSTQTTVEYTKNIWWATEPAVTTTQGSGTATGASSTCESTVCSPGFRCEMKQVTCVMAPCNPIPTCVPITSQGAGNLNSDVMSQVSKVMDQINNNAMSAFGNSSNSNVKSILDRIVNQSHDVVNHAAEMSGNNDNNSTSS